MAVTSLACLTAAEAELAKQAALIGTEPALPRAPRPRAGRQPLPDHLRFCRNKGRGIMAE